MTTCIVGRFVKSMQRSVRRKGSTHAHGDGKGSNAVLRRHVSPANVQHIAAEWILRTSMVRFVRCKNKSCNERAQGRVCGSGNCRRACAHRRRCGALGPRIKGRGLAALACGLVPPRGATRILQQTPLENKIRNYTVGLELLLNNNILLLLQLPEFRVEICKI